MNTKDLFLAHANKDNLENYHYFYNLLSSYLEKNGIPLYLHLPSMFVENSFKNMSFEEALDKAFKDNGYPFGILWNNEATQKNLAQNIKDYGLITQVEDFFKGENAINFLLDKKMGYIEKAFHKEGYGEGKNEWILTAYKRENPPAQNFDQVTNSKELEIVETISL